MIPILLSHQYFLSTIDFFKVFWDRSVVTSIESNNLENRIFSFGRHSLAVRTSIEVNIAVELDTIIPASGFNRSNVIEPIVEADPSKLYVINIESFFVFFYICLYFKHCAFERFWNLFMIVFFCFVFKLSP